MLFSRTIYNEYTDIIKGSDKEGKKEREGERDEEEEEAETRRAVKT